MRVAGIRKPRLGNKELALLSMITCVNLVMTPLAPPPMARALVKKTYYPRALAMCTTQRSWRVRCRHGRLEAKSTAELLTGRKFNCQQ